MEFSSSTVDSVHTAHPVHSVHSIHSPPPARRWGWWAGAILLAGLALRLIPALFPVYWFDEIYTFSISRFSYAEIARITIGDVHPPLFYWIIKTWMALGAPWVGPATAMPWLRIPPMIAGMAVCVALWRAGRSRWSPEAALGLLALAAFSPGLAAYSIEIRNYSFTQCFMVLGALALIRAVETNETAPRTARRAWLGWTLSWAAALYTHNIALIYFCAQAGLILVELWLRRRRRADARALAMRAALALGAMAVIYGPWLPALIEQNGALRRLDLPWMPPTDLRAALATFFYHFPLGLLDSDPFAGPAPLALMIAAGLALASLAAFAVGGSRSAAPTPDSSRLTDRLWLHATAMTFVPLAVAYVVSTLGHSRIFMASRYNMLALPFWIVVVAGLACRVPIQLRRGAFVALALASLGFAIPTQYERFQSNRNEFSRFGRLQAGDPAPRQGDKFFWIDDEVAPWLFRSAGNDIRDLYDFLNAREDTLGGNVWLLSHLNTGSTLRRGETSLRLAAARFAEAEGVLEEINERPYWVFLKIYRAQPAAREVLSRHITAARAAIAARRAAVAPGHQLLLPGDLVFADRAMWSVEEYSPDYNVSCWTVGERQVARWRGPERPGRYIFRATFWRAQPFPTEKLTIRVKPPRAERSLRADAPLGSVVVEAPIEVTRSRQWLTAEFKIPTWRPSEVLGTEDSRDLGLMLLSVEVIPAPER